MKRLLILLAVLLCVAGCSSSGSNTPGGGGGSTVITTSSNFTLEPTVRLLPAEGIAVGAIEDGSVVLNGAVPNLAPGDVIVKNTGDEQFIRKVVSVTQNGDQFVITTARVGFSDIFQDASIQQTEVLGADVLSQFEPSMPGVTFGEPEPVATRIAGKEVAAFRLPIHFNRAVVEHGVNGSIEITGSIGIRFTIESGLEVHKFLGIPTGLRQFKIVPGCIVDGNLSITGAASGSFRQQVPLSNPLSFNLVGFGPVGINANCQLMLEIDGYVQANGSLSMNGKITMSAGIEYTDTNGWSTPRSFKPEFSVDAPDVRVNARVACSAIKPKFSINVLGMGEVWVDADLLRLEATFEFVTLPERGYRITTFRDFGFNAGADIVVDIGIAKLVDLHGRLPRVQFGLEKLSEHDIPEFPQPPTPNGLHIFPFSVQVRQGEVAKVTSYARYLIFPVPEVSTWSSDDPSIASVSPSDTEPTSRASRPERPTCAPCTPPESRPRCWCACCRPRWRRSASSPPPSRCKSAGTFRSRLWACTPTDPSEISPTTCAGAPAPATRSSIATATSRRFWRARRISPRSSPIRGNRPPPGCG